MGYLDSKVKQTAGAVASPVKQAGGRISGMTKGLQKGGPSGMLEGFKSGDPLSEANVRDILAKVRSAAEGTGPGVPQLKEMRTLDPRALLQQPAPLGESQWSNFALQKQAADQARGLDTAVQQQQQALAAGRAASMGRGGMGSGAGEALAGQGGIDLMKLKQGQNQQGLLAKTGLMQQAADKQLSTNKFNNAVSSDVSRTNLGNQIQDLGKENDWGTTRYGEHMKLLSAGRTADAMAANAKSAGKK